MEQRPEKRKGDAQDGPPKKKMSFAERILAKSGWQPGDGLGKDGQGRITPVDVVQRPSKVGVGAVREKSANHKKEERRKAQLNGEVYVSSSEEEREEKKARRKKKGLPGSGATSGSSTPRIKQKFTVAGLEADGLVVPSALTHLIDMSSAQKRITDSSKLSLNLVPAENEASRLAARAQRDLAAYGQAWNDLVEESKTIDYQMQTLSKDVERLELEIDTAKRRRDLAQELAQQPTVENVLEKLVAMPSEYRDETLATAAIHPKLAPTLSDWHPLDPEDTKVLTQLARLNDMLFKSRNALILQSEEIDKPKKRATTPYESMVQLLVLPKLREAILAWNPQAPYEMCALVKSIEPLLPKFINNHVNQALVIKVSRELHDFSPRMALKKKKQLPHTWVIPMLEVLPENITGGLLGDAKRKLRACLEIWPLQPLPGLSLWKQVFSTVDFNNLMVNTVIPRLSALLRTDFLVDPTDQKLDTLNKFLSWSPFVKREHMVELVQALIIPPILSVLHQWLEGEPNYEEVGQWYLWWKDQLSSLNDLTQVAEMINRAIDGNLEVFSDEAEQPIPEPVRPVDTPSKEPPKRKEMEEATFKDIVEGWCSEEDLLLIALREAHPTTGLPLFRITANAVGRGGVVVYMKGDVLYAAEKKDKTVWKPIGLGSELVDKAEGK